MSFSMAPLQALKRAGARRARAGGFFLQREKWIREEVNERSGYAGIVVATKLLEQALRRIEQLPDSEQDAAAWVLLDYVKHMRDRRLTDVQVAEVQRRMADPDRRLVSHADARERIARLDQ
jgi:hypothetical protein